MEANRKIAENFLVSSALINELFKKGIINEKECSSLKKYFAKKNNLNSKSLYVYMVDNPQT